MASHGSDDNGRLELQPTVRPHLGGRLRPLHWEESGIGNYAPGMVEISNLVKTLLTTNSCQVNMQQSPLPILLGFAGSLCHKPSLTLSRPVKPAMANHNQPYNPPRSFHLAAVGCSS